MKSRRNRSAREIICCAVLLLVACLVTDMATPFLPGAFRLNPSESIEATTGRTFTAAVVAPHPLALRFHRRLHVEYRMVVRARRTTGYPQHRQDVPFVRSRLLPAFAPSDASNASDDDWAAFSGGSERVVTRVTTGGAIGLCPMTVAISLSSDVRLM